MSEDKDTRLLSDDDPEIQEALERYTPREIDTGRLTDRTELLIMINDDVKRFPLTEQATWLLGRFETIDHPNQIDLSPYDARPKGVSRLHLQLHVQDNLFYATDLNSSNGTYLNDIRLVPNKASYVPNGAILLLGVFPIQIVFR